MPHPKDDEIFPIGSTVFWKKRNCFAIIVDHGTGKDGREFLNYYVNEIKGREGNFAAYHDDLTLIDLPPVTN